MSPSDQFQHQRHYRHVAIFAVFVTKWTQQEAPKIIALPVNILISVGTKTLTGIS